MAEGGGRVPKAASTARPTLDRYDDNLEATDAGFVVGVVDTGLIEGGHPWLAGHAVTVGAFDPRPPSALELGEDDGHGTFVSGLILREAPRAMVRVIRALDIDQNTRTVDVDIAAAITGLLQDPVVKVINLSFGGRIWEGRPPSAIRDAIGSAGDAEVVVVAPAGNLPTGDPVWPAAFAYEFDHVISVGAVDETPNHLQGRPPPRASFSNFGYWVKAFAAGVDVLGPFFDLTEPGSRDDTGSVFSGWARWSGSSFAAATVAGVIARTAMEQGGTALPAALQLVRNRRDHLIYEPGWARPVTYVPSAASTWSLTPPEFADRRADADG